MDGEGGRPGGSLDAGQQAAPNPGYLACIAGTGRGKAVPLALPPACTGEGVLWCVDPKRYSEGKSYGR